ncbi:MAG TPA: alpha/beta hydrolase [Amnibacterium sp.]|nr:alpha/beta hydrolase [Amnibacterium sp.]
MTLPRLVLLHGSVTNASWSWRRQSPLADTYELVAPNRPGFGPGDPPRRVDFEVDAAWLPSVVEPGDHLVAHSYGGVVALLAAHALPLRSLTLLEPPALAVARGDAAVERWLTGYAGLDSANAFLAHVGAPLRVPEDAPADLRRGAEALLTERPPHEAQIELAPLPYPVLVVTGGHEPAFEAVGDVLARGLHAERAVVRGAGHAVQSAPGFNDLLCRFLERT